MEDGKGRRRQQAGEMQNAEEGEIKGMRGPRGSIPRDFDWGWQRNFRP
jgi:hypothetical protein